MTSLDLNQLLNIAQLLVLMSGGIMVIYRLGRFSGSIQQILEEHERRITKLENPHG